MQIEALGEDGAVQHDVRVFKTVGDVSLNIHIFRGSPGPDAAAIVFFFGGGWNGGNPKQFFPHCRYLASRGMVAMSAEYRVRSVHGTTPFACIADGKSAVRWARAQAGELGIDANRVAAGGGSAGGHVAACTGALPVALDGPGEDQNVSSRPDAMVLFNPVSDTTVYDSERFGGRDPIEASPLHHVESGTPPAILFHGNADTTVAFATAAAFVEKMKDCGNDCELLVGEGHAHGYFNYGRNDNAPFHETVTAADRFLARHGFLEGAPTL